MLNKIDVNEIETTYYRTGRYAENDNLKEVAEKVNDLIDLVNKLQADLEALKN